MDKDHSSISLVQLEFRRAKVALFNRRQSPKNEKATSYAQVATSVKQQAVQQKSCGLKPGKSRPSHIGIRLSPEEREIVVQRAQKSCLTISEYVRASVLGAGYLSAIDPIKRKLLQDISRELGRQGNNLNQIAKHLNAEITSPEQGNSVLTVITRSLLSAHQSVREALTEGKEAP